MKRIYFVDDLLVSHNNGVGTYRKTLTQALIRRKYKVDVLSLDYGKKYGKIEENGVTLHFLKDALTVDDIKDVGIEDSTDNVVIFNKADIDSISTASRELPKSKIVLIMHDFVWTDFLDGDIHRLKRLINTHGTTKEERDMYAAICNEKHVMDIADMVVCLSKSAKMAVVSHYNISAHKVRVIPNGIAPCPAQPDKEDFLLYVGRLTPAKGFPELAEVVNDIGARLVVLGKGKHIGGKNIEYRGHVDNVSQWYDKSKAVVIPSHFEQCSYVALEAMVHGCLVVASNAIGLRDMFNERNAVIFEKGNKDSLKSALQRVNDMSDTERRAKIRALKNTMLMYTLQKMVFNYERKIFN